MTGEPMYPTMEERMVPGLMLCLNMHPSYQLLTEVAITLLFQLRYIMLQMKNSRSASAINPVTMKNMDDLQMQGSHRPMAN